MEKSRYLSWNQEFILRYLLNTLGFLISLVCIAQKTYIWYGNLIDGVSDEPRMIMTIVVEKNKIPAVENGYSRPGTADRTIELKTRTLTPG